MNILNTTYFADDYVPPAEFIEPTVDELHRLLAERQQVYQGFAALEADQGFLKPEMSLVTKAGQDGLRLLWARAIEEVLEATDAHDRHHILEELIDALNYFLAMYVFDPKMDLAELAEQIQAQIWQIYRTEANLQTTTRALWTAKDVLDTALGGANSVLERLRNRSWQQSVQSSYFDGTNELQTYIVNVFYVIRLVFATNEEFFRYYWAKHEVLIFRLGSGY